LIEIGLEVTSAFVDLFDCFFIVLIGSTLVYLESFYKSMKFYKMSESCSYLISDKLVDSNYLF